jgi:hypothetical protein
VEHLKLAGYSVDTGVVISRLPLLLVACSLALLPTSVGEARSGKTLTIKILSVVNAVGETDVEPKGLSAGDRIRITDRLYNLAPQFGKPNGAFVGTDSGISTVRQGGRSADFRGTARLPGGTIRVRGRYVVTGTLPLLTVVGGTGRFARARGTVSITALAGKGRARNVFRLTLR